MVVSDGSEATSSSESYECWLEGIMYADIENEGLDEGGEADMLTVYSERRGKERYDCGRAVACLLPCGDQSICSVSWTVLIPVLRVVGRRRGWYTYYVSAGELAESCGAA